MSIEKEITGIIESSEEDRRKPTALVKKIRAFAPEGLEKAAADPNSTAYELVAREYPDILERELMAGALANEFLNPGSDLDAQIDDVYAQNEAAIEQGHDRNGYGKLVEKRGDYIDLVNFLTIMNDTEYDEIEKRIAAEDRAKEKKEKEEAERKETLERFGNYRILVPTEKNQEGNVELTLKEYLEGIAGKMAKSQISKEEYKTRVTHLKANFDFAFEAYERRYIFEEYTKLRKEALDKWSEWKGQAILHELTEEESAKAKTAFDKYQKASYELDIVSDLLGLR